MTQFISTLAALLAGVCCAGAAASEVTSRQAGEILKELRQIRQLLEKQQTPQGVAQVPLQAPEVVRMRLGTEISLGKADAPVTIVEFNDLQCPFCNRFQTTAFADIKKNYIDTGRVRFIHRDMPLEELHPQAIRAARAARCAGDQGKFWKVLDSVITHQASMSPQSIDQMAKDAGVDELAYRSCIESNAHLEEVQSNAASARELGLSGTPSFVIGRVNGGTLEGQKLVGAMPYQTFDAVIRAALAR